MIFVKKYPFYYYEVRFGFGTGSVLLVRVRVRFGRTKKSWFGRSLVKIYRELFSGSSFIIYVLQIFYL